MLKRTIIVFLAITLVLLLTVSYLGTGRTINFMWHIFNSYKIIYKGINIELPKDWWVYDENNENIVLSKVPKKTEPNLMLTISRKNYDVKRIDIKGYMNQVCQNAITQSGQVSISGERAVEIMCSNQVGNQIEYVWLVPSKNVVIMSSAQSNTDKNVFYDLLKGIRW